MQPGEYLIDADAEPIAANAGRATVTVTVGNTGDRPIQVGSHYHFFEVNRALRFDRTAAYGMRLNVPAGTAVRFEPGEEKDVELTAFAGTRTILGHNGLVMDALDDAGARDAAVERMRSSGFLDTGADGRDP